MGIDYAMVEGCRRGDPEWQRRLYETYSPRLYALCCRYASSREQAEDILVESFVAIYRSIADVRDVGALEQWMRRVVTNRALNLLREQRRRDRHVTILTENVETAVETDLDTPLDMQAALEQGLQQMDPRMRTVFNLVAIEGYPEVEVAKMLRVPAGTVKSRYYRARKIMQALLDDIAETPYAEKTKEAEEKSKDEN
ncbi:MAG: RNA polymerase sigma factor [Bacteroidales bacterium]|nr:RNA polymerase sigma factor [Bacteroidales bacterium]